LSDYEKTPQSTRGDMADEHARQLRYALDSFDSSHKSFVEESLTDAETQAGQNEAFLSVQEAKSEPLFLQKDQIDRLRQRIGLAEALARPGEPRIGALKATLADIEKKDAALRATRMAQTRMGAESYRGGDAAELKAKAESIVLAKASGVKILRTTLISSDWKEESVLEYTDTTQTAVRYRTTRSLTAQVAARGDGKVLLYTINLGKDRQADGAWGAVYGHVMYTDPMLEENVAK
ncbi:MAG: hypothetical protein V2A34_00780, partial [Lentisphaerota bacterium]